MIYDVKRYCIGRFNFRGLSIYIVGIYVVLYLVILVSCAQQASIGDVANSAPNFLLFVFLPFLEMLNARCAIKPKQSWKFYDMYEIKCNT